MTELSVLQEAQMRELGSADFRQTLDGFLKMATILDRRSYMEAIAHRSRVLRDWLAFLEVYPVMLTPLSVKRTPEANADLGGDARVRSLFWNDLRFMSSINVLGLPAAVVPIGLVAGNPVGVIPPLMGGIADRWGVSESFYILGALMLLLCAPQPAPNGAAAVRAPPRARRAASRPSAAPRTGCPLCLRQAPGTLGPAGISNLLDDTVSQRPVPKYGSCVGASFVIAHWRASEAACTASKSWR